MTDRVPSSCSHKWSAQTCKKCGIYDHPSDPAVKTNHFDSYLNSSSAKYLKNMRKRQCKQIYNKQINQATFCLLQSICQKFQYSMQTLALGIHIYAKASQKSQKDQKFWASSALIVASKGIELDKRVPYLNRYQRYADKSYSQQQYQEAQRAIFEDIEFNVQFTTFVSFLNFYLTNGVLFKSDSFNIAITKYIQEDMISKARDYLKTGEFLKWNQEMLALSIIKEIRAKFRLDPWKKQLEIISGFTEQKIESHQSEHLMLKPAPSQTKIKQKQLIPKSQERQPLSLNSLSLNFGQNSLLSDEKVKAHKKPLDSLKLHNLSTTLHTNPSSTSHSHSLLGTHLKENSSKILSEIPLSLATLRNHVTSANKYVIGDRLATVNSFVTSRRF